MTNQIQPSIAPVIPQDVNPTPEQTQDSPLMSLSSELFARIGFDLPPLSMTHLLITCKECLQKAPYIEAHFRGQLELQRNEEKNKMRKLFLFAKEKGLTTEPFEQDIARALDGLTPQNIEQTRRSIDIYLFQFFHSLSPDKVAQLREMASLHPKQRWVDILEIDAKSREAASDLDFYALQRF